MARLKNYQYLDIVTEHLNNDETKVFNNELIYPRQLEVHLPSDRKEACNFHCHYCQGKQLNQDLGNWEEDGLRVMEGLKGKIPYYVYGGAYTEPLMNEFLPDYLKLSKKYGNNFGMHTNGSLFYDLEEQNGLCSLITNIAKTPLDYVSVSLDGGTPESHMKVKSVNEDWFTKIIEGIKVLVKLRGNRAFPSIRVCYLMTKFNCSEEEIAGIVKIFKDIGVDSLRFSVPYDHYGKTFERVTKYKHHWEIPFGDQCEKTVTPHLSKSFAEKPYVFWHPPGFQDVEKMNFKECIYSYYQITFGADGYVYKCSSTASPTFTHARLGKVPGNLQEFDKMVLANHEKKFDAKSCFNVGARCNRIALEINGAWDKGTLFDGKKPDENANLPHMPSPTTQEAEQLVLN